VTAAADRAACAAVYWARRGDGAAIRLALAGLGAADHAETVWLLQNVDFDGLTDAELRVRMLDAAAVPPDVF
jgi:hypothetical protein